MNDLLTLDDCWNRIGIQGDQSCDRLEEFFHCRNCPMYADAARLLMQRRVPAAYALEWAERFAAPNAIERVGEQSMLVFRLGLEWLGLPTSCLVRITDQTMVHHLPHRSNEILSGIVNAGGKLTAQFSLAALLGIDDARQPAASDHHLYARLMVLALGAHTIAVPAQELHGIVRYGAADVVAAPDTVNRGIARYLAGVTAVGAMQVGLLDAGLLTRVVAEALL